MAARILHEKAADRRVLRDKVCAILGFGSQGRAQALNLRDSGLTVVIGLPPKSRSRRPARQEGFHVLSTTEAVRAGEVIFLALPDTRMESVFAEQIRPALRPGQTLLFAHGFAVTYGLVRAPRGVDVVMVAPKGLGPMVRSEFVAGRGVPGLIAVGKGSSARARRVALGWAAAIGCTRAGVIETTFREETETDLFSEQAVLCGGVTRLVLTGFETLVEAGYAPELAYFECLHELKFIVDLMHERGVAGMRARISETALWGDLTIGPRVIDASVRRRMNRILTEIRQGKFARDLLRETRTGGKNLRRLREAAEKHPLERTGKRLRAQLGWSKKKGGARRA